MFKITTIADQPATAAERAVSPVIVDGKAAMLDRMALMLRKRARVHLRIARRFYRAAGDLTLSRKLIG